MTTIDLTPTWRGIAPVLFRIIRDAETPEALRTGYDELLRMAALADRAVAAAAQFAFARRDACAAAAAATRAAFSAAAAERSLAAA